jgi:hypothetical protein
MLLAVELRNKGVSNQGQLALLLDASPYHLTSCSHGFEIGADSSR